MHYVFTNLLFLFLPFNFYGCDNKSDSRGPSPTPILDEEGLPDAGANEALPNDHKEEFPNHVLRNLLVSDSIPRFNFSTEGKIKSPKDLETICTSTGGQWHPNLYTCTCDHNMLFAPQLGCRSIEVSSKGMACLKEGLSKTLHKEVSEFDQCLKNMFPKGSFIKFSGWDKSSIEEKESLASLLDEKAFSFLEGRTFNLQNLNLFEDENVGLIYKLTPFKDKFTEYSSASVVYFHPAPEIPYSMRINPLNSELKFQFTEQSCNERIKAHVLSDENGAVEKLCKLLTKNLGKIQDPSHRLSFDPLYDTRLCTFCSESSVDFGEEGLSYSVSFKDYHSIERVLFIYTKEISSVVTLDTKGFPTVVEVQRMVKSQEAHDDGKIYTSETLFLDGKSSQFKYKKIHHTILKDLWTYLKKRKSKTLKNTVNSDYWGMHLVDDNFDLSESEGQSIYLNAERLKELPDHYVEEEFLSYFKKGQIFDHPYLNSMSEKSFSLGKSYHIKEASSKERTHSNKIAEPLMKGLENVSLTLYTELFDPNYTSSEFTREFLIKHNVKVVASAAGYTERIEGITRRILSENTDVVFVFSAGNFDCENYVMDPAMTASWSQLPNVLVAASYDPSKPDLVLGNRGQVPTIAVPGSAGGTSYASVKLANLAMKLRKKYPEHTAEEIVHMIYEHGHDVQGLSVRSGKLADMDIRNY